MQITPEIIKIIAELGGTVFIAFVAFKIWHSMSEKKDKLIIQLIKDAKEDRELNRKTHEESSEKISKAHSEGMSEVAIALTRLSESHAEFLHRQDRYLREANDYLVENAKRTQ